MPAASEPQAQALADTAAAFLVASRAVGILQRRTDGRVAQNADKAWAAESRESFILLGRPSSSIEVMSTDKRLVEFRANIEKAAAHAVRRGQLHRQRTPDKLMQLKHLQNDARTAFGSELAQALLASAPEMSVFHPSHWYAAMDSIRFVQNRTARNQKYLGGAPNDGLVERRVAFETLLATSFWFNIEANFELETPQQTLT